MKRSQRLGVLVKRVLLNVHSLPCSNASLRWSSARRAAARTRRALVEDANLLKDLMVDLPHARAEALSLGLEELAHRWVVRKPRAGEGGGVEGLDS